LRGTPPGAAEGFARTEAWPTTRRGGSLGPVHLGSQEDFYEEALDAQEGGCGQEEHHAEEDFSTARLLQERETPRASARLEGQEGEYSKDRVTSLL